MSGATIMAPITVALESDSTLYVAMTAQEVLERAWFDTGFHSTSNL